MFNPNTLYDGEWRDVDTGVDPTAPDDAQPSFDAPGIPPEPITTRFEGPWGMPWYDATEDPYITVDVPISPDPLPWTPDEGSVSAGNAPMVGTYRGEYKTLGPIQAWGHEPSGGLGGDQAIGRIMRFPANIPSRFDAYGVWDTDVRDDIAGALMVDDLPYLDDKELAYDLLQWPGV